ncbi:MAG: T9SS type A sorting domain-containing protein [Ignavibacteriaceae bacterium]
MRKVLILFLGLFLISLTTSFAQGLMDYVKEVKGDTLVVNDYIDMGQVASSLTNVIIADSDNVPAGRVYELQSYGWYPLGTNITTPANRPVTIVGADNTPLVNNQGDAPPIISGFVNEGGANSGGLTYQNDFTMKNTATCVGAPDGSYGWAFYGPGNPDLRGVFENCTMEHTWWVMLQSNAWAGSRIYFKDCYFVNMSGLACRRNGGVYDNVNNPTDTMYVENCTHVMAEGMMYKFRNYPVDWIFINHNTFINCAGTFFETQGYQSNVIIANNIFVNSNLQPFRPGVVEDIPEIDADQLPSGLINVAVLPDSLPQVPRKWLVEANVAYWDPNLADLAAEANTMAINTFTNWVNQSITMNTRTQSFFDDDATYPFLTEGRWYNQLPNFTNSADLLTDQVNEVKTWALACVDTDNVYIMADWRVSSTDFLYADWPIPVDLSYSDAGLMTGGTDGLPVGDLNWFPTAKATFNSNMNTYHTALIDAWNNGHTVLAVRELGGIATEYKLTQNYPNPFNPTTKITFTIPEPGNVTLKVYDVTGKEIATLVNGFKTAQSYEVQFDGANISSGVYFYTLSTDNFRLTKKMILMK